MRYLILLFFFVTLGSTAQVRQDGKWSMEGSLGLEVPFSPANFINTSDYTGFKQFQLSLRYMFNDKYGLKGHYGYNRFEDKNDRSLFSNYHRIGLEGVANLGNVFDFMQRSEIDLLGHFGGGLTFTTYRVNPGDPYDNIGNIILGFTGLREISRGVDVLADITFVKSFEVQHAYSGEFIDKGLPHEGYGGLFMNISVGLVIYLAPN